jgi:hypothetical protein
MPSPTAHELPHRRLRGRGRAHPRHARCRHLPRLPAEIRDPTDRRLAMPSPIAPIAARGSRSSTGCPMTGRRPPWPSLRDVPACRAEYEDPGDRRFHAQPVACAACGPTRLARTGRQSNRPATCSTAADLLKEGRILAIKGIGGFHLACDATNAEAIATLRARKGRPAKPLALMAPLGVLLRHAAPTAEELDLLQGPAAPIVLSGESRRVARPPRPRAGDARLDAALHAAPSPSVRPSRKRPRWS